MQEITGVMIDVRKVEKLEDTFENSGDYGTEYTIRIYDAQNNHLSKDEISNLLRMGQAKISIVKVI